MEIIAFSKNGNTNRQDLPSPKGWDEFFGPRDQITHIRLFILLEEEYAPISEFGEWIFKHEEFRYFVHFVMRTRWNTWTKVKKIEDAISELWIQWFQKAIFVSNEGKEHDLKDTLQYMADVGFKIRWHDDEKKLVNFVAKLNMKYGRGRGANAKGKGAVKRFTDRLRMNFRHGYSYSVVPGLKYGATEKTQHNDFKGNYISKSLDIKFDNDKKARIMGRIRADNSIITGEIGCFNTELDREAFIKDYYNQLLQSTIQDIF